MSKKDKQIESETYSQIRESQPSQARESENFTFVLREEGKQSNEFNPSSVEPPAKDGDISTDQRKDSDIVFRPEKEPKDSPQINLEMNLQDTNSNITSVIPGKPNEPTYSVSDLVNYESIDDKGNSLKFLKHRGKDNKEAENDDYLKISPPKPDIDKIDIAIAGIKKEVLSEDRKIEENPIERISGYPVHEETPPLSPPQELNESYSSGKVKIEESERESHVNENKIYETYEDFVKSVASKNSPVQKIEKKQEVKQITQEKSLAIDATLKQKAIEMEKARIELKEKQKKKQIEEIKRKAKENEDKKKRVKAATTIQKILRGGKLRIAYNKIKESSTEHNKKIHAATIIQKVYKGYIARKIFKTAKESLPNNQNIQNNQNDKNSLEEKSAMTIFYGLQKWHQHKLKEKEDLIKRYTKHCAVFIQKIFRGFSARIRFEKMIQKRRRYIQLRKAVLVGWKTRKILECKKIQVIKQAILKIDSNDPKQKEDRGKKIDSFIRMFYVLYTTGQWATFTKPPPVTPKKIIQ